MQPSGNYVSQLKNKQSGLVHLVTGKDRGRDVWYYVHFENKAKYMMFNARGKTDSGAVDIENYGRILHSGWGKLPPSELTKKLQEEYS